MPEQFLHHSHVGAALQQVGRKRVTQRVRRDRHTQFRGLGGPLGEPLPIGHEFAGEVVSAGPGVDDRIVPGLRVAVTGQSVSPPLFESMAVIGRETVLARVRRTVQVLEAAARAPGAAAS